MSRGLALALIGVMLAMVIGQELRLRGYESHPVVQITLHESRLVPFLQEIRHDSPDTYDSIVLNLMRIRDAQALRLNHELEEIVVAEQLFARLTGVPAAAASAASGPGR